MKREYFVYSVTMDRADHFYYGDLARLAMEYITKKKRALLVGGAGCTVGGLLFGLGVPFDVVEPSDVEHVRGKELYAGLCEIRYHFLEEVLKTDILENRYGVVVWDAWVGTRCVAPTVDFLERCFYGGVSVVANVGDTARGAEVKVLVDGRK